MDKLNIKVEELRKLKIKTLVQTKKAEYWIKETKEDSYNDLVKDFEECKTILKRMIGYRKNPWYIHLIAQTIVFIRNPIKYFTVRNKARKYMIDSYWEMKSIKKEWDDDYAITEKLIDKNYEIIEKANKTIEMLKEKGKTN